MKDIIEKCKRAIEEDDAVLLRQLLEEHPSLKTRINEPLAPFDSPILSMARSRAMLEVMLAAGADINAKSRWWAGGFGFLHTAKPELATYAIERGAVVDAHAAARLNLLERLREIIAADPALVNARGGDGQTPLHFAATVEIAEFLLDRGADINARDVDHESTPAQYMVRDRQAVLSYLITRGCKTDLFMAAALGDADLARAHIDADPGCIRMRVNDEHFPKANRHSGGTIFQWTLGWHVSPHDVAREFGHYDVLQLLTDRSPADLKLIVACWAGDETAANSLLAENPGLVNSISDPDRRQVAHAARNNNLAAVRLMLASGLAPNALGQHGGTPLHWAAFHGNAELAREILRYHPPLELTDADFHSTPLGWAIHGSEHGWYCKTGNYAGTVEELLKAGARLPEKGNGGTQAVKAALRKHSGTG